MEKNIDSDSQISLKLSDDSCDIPQISVQYNCEKCGIPTAVVSSDSLCWTNIMGYLMHRIRVVTKCKVCGTISTYRLGGHVVSNGRFVHNSDATN